MLGHERDAQPGKEKVPEPLYFQTHSMILNQRPIDKAIEIGDIHLGIRNNSMEWLHNIDVLFFHRFLIPYLRSLPDIDRYQLFLTGDLFDSKQMYSLVVQNRARYTIKELAKILPVHIDLGNHDLYSDKPMVLENGEEIWINACDFLSDIDNVQVYLEPTTLETVTGMKFTIIPFIGTPNHHDVSREVSIIEEIKKQHNDYLFMHTTIEGFFYEGKPIVEGEGITKQLLAPFKKVKNGHIHSMQEDGNILILGTPYHTKMSECDNPCYIYDVDYSSRDEVTKMVENKISPRYRNTNIFRIMEMTVDKAKKYVSNCYCRFKVPNHLTNSYDFVSIRDILAEHARTIEFDPLVSEEMEAELVVGDEGIDTGMGKVDIRGKYPEYIEKLSMVNLSSKETLEVPDSMKPKLLEDFNALFTKAERGMNVNDLE